VNDLYRALGVEPTATPDEIREAYWRQVRVQSSDREPGQRLRELREAYETLTDPERRARYDATGDGAPPTPFMPLPEPQPVEQQRHHSRNPLDRLTARLPRPWRIAIDWIVTIAGAILIVLAIKQWVVNPYRIPSSSMEPTLHCARPGPDCEARLSDRVLANRFIYHFRSPHRGEIIVFKTPTKAAQAACNASGTFVKRLIGLPGDRVTYERNVLAINGKIFKEPYVKPARAGGKQGTWVVPPGRYFFMGDNRRESCDSRVWGYVPKRNIIGEVFMTYWPPNRIAFHAILLSPWLFGLALLLSLRRRKV
jgi:signal peptidase I